ncbi:MAG TPA: glycosyltransferase family 4 protein [Opitutaceae bacterium]|nr:glycosyltransferase family 4 protein [Opitutaceae bacterium]
MAGGVADAPRILIMRVLLAHPGTQHAFRLARELDARGLLGEFWTGFALAEHGAGAAFARTVRGWPMIGGLGSRIATGVAGSRVRTIPGNELRALWQLRQGGESHAVLHDRNRRFQQRIPSESLAHSDAIIGFDTSGWVLTERAAAANKPFMLDRSIAHPACIARNLAQLRLQYPEWQSADSGRPAEVRAAEDAEHAGAARIVVAGSFARQSLLEAGIDPAKIRVNPYGVDWSRFAATAPATGASPGETRPVRFLFVGSLIGRKGVPVLIEAWRRVSPRDAELWLVGPCGARERALIPPLAGLRVVGPVPHPDLPGIYGSADVLVLPSFVEGFGLVLLEALAAGLPIISTPNTGAVDLIREPAMGAVVPAGSVGALEAELRRWLAAPPDRARVSAAATPLAATHSWTAYGDRWAEILREFAT